MKKWRFGVLPVILCFLLSGCHRGKSTTVQSSVVTRIDITCENGSEVFRRSYTSPDKMRLVLLYIRSVSSPFASLPEPEDEGQRKIRITTTSANNITKVYRQHGEQFFQEGSGGWQRIDPEKGSILWELIQSLPGDLQGDAAPVGMPEKQDVNNRQNFSVFLKNVLDNFETLRYNGEAVCEKCCYSSAGRAHPW